MYFPWWKVKPFLILQNSRVGVAWGYRLPFLPLGLERQFRSEGAEKQAQNTVSGPVFLTYLLGPGNSLLFTPVPAITCNVL